MRRAALLLCALAVAGCDLSGPAPVRPYDPARPPGVSGAMDPPDGAVAMEAAAPVNPYPANPYPADWDAAARGADLYRVFCAPCHGAAGHGDGPVRTILSVAPPSFHDPRLREAPDGHLLRVIEHGRGIMYGYGSRVTAPERADIVAFLRALQAKGDTSR